jgi:N-acetylmuramoyl-L-alanine amidase
MKILIDNGHGENTMGKRSPVWSDGSQLFEWKYTREIARRIETELKKQDVDVELLVPEDTDISLSERCKRANAIAGKSGKDRCLLVSIHNNAANGKARGWEIHVFSGGSVSDRYASVFWNKAKELLPKDEPIRGDIRDGNPAWNSNFAILRDTICPAVLTENLFMDNEEDCRYLLSETGKKIITAIHVQSIQIITGK